MITWSEQTPDFYRAPLTDLADRLPFVTACTMVLNPGPWPLVAAHRDAMEAIWDHLAEQAVEMGGLLIGSVHDLPSDGSRFVISISDYVRSVEFDGTGVSLRMDPDVWEKARLKAGEGRFVVGWYHSHPNLGVFFSGTDRRTQRAFFHHPHSVGVVIDPVRKEEKWFLGGNSEELGPQQILRHQ